MSPGPELSIVLPAYEEAANLDFLLPRLSEVARTLTPQFELVVVDTEVPRDATPEVCARHGARYAPRQGGSFYGDALRTAVQQAQGKYVVLMDADGSHNPAFVTELWRYRQEADLVIASRYVHGGHTENPWILILMSRVVNIVFRLVLGLHSADVSNSFRLYRGEDFRSLRLKCNNFDVVEEILVKLVLLRPDFKVKEIPSRFEKRKAGKTKRNLLAFAFTYLISLVRIYRLKRAARKGSPR